MSELSAKKKSGTNSGLAGGLAFLLAKGKALFVMIAKMKGLLTVLSMTLSILVYWKTWHLGLAGAVGFVLLLLIHEYGHVLALRRLGVPASAPLFIPFVGAVIGMKKRPNNATEEAFMAIAGPALGTVGALACFAVYGLTHAHIWLWLASMGFFLNLFNLIPLSPLDGGRIIGAVWRGFWLVALLALAGAGIWWNDFILWYLVALGIMEVSSRYKKLPIWTWLIYSVGCVWFACTAHSLLPVIVETAFAIASFWYFAHVVLKGGKEYLSRSSIDAQTDPAYFSVAPKIRLVITLGYLGLAALLAALFYLTATIATHVTVA